MTYRLLRRCLFILLVAMLCGASAFRTTSAQGLPAAAPADVGMSAARLARISKVLGEHVEQGNIPGAVVMVVRHGKLVYADAIGYRDPASGARMSTDSIFRIYSMTKPLVSVAAMMLVEDGRMQLTDPVSKFLPAFKNMQVSVAQADSEFARVSYTLVPATREMTVHDLLRHTAGLSYGEISNNQLVKDGYIKAGAYQQGVRDFDSREMTPEQQIERVAKIPLAHQPGTVWAYSFASDILGRVVEAASGLRLGDFLAARLFQPLGMVDSGFAVPADHLGRLAEPLPVDRVSGQANRLIDVRHVPLNDSGGAGGVSTAADYARFAMMLLGGGRLGDTRILSRPAVALMTSDHLGPRISVPMMPSELLLGTPGYSFGLGFAVRQGAGIAGVPGSPGEFTWGGYAGTLFWVDPKEDLVGIYMSQAPGPSRPYYRRLFKTLVYQAIDD